MSGFEILSGRFNSKAATLFEGIGVRGSRIFMRKQQSMKPQQSAFKMIHCWNTVPDQAPSHHLSHRLEDLLKRGWTPRLAHFNRSSAFVWLEPKTKLEST